MLYELMKQLMLGGELKFGEGKITFMGQRMQLVNSSLFAYRLKYAKDFWKEAQLQYRAMKDANIQGWFSPVKEEKGLKGDELIKWAVNYFSLGGYGKFNFEVSKIAEGRVRVRIEDGPFAQEYKRVFGLSKRPVCHITRGGLSAGGSAVLNKEIEVVEEQCVAQGHPCCVMMFRPKTDFEGTKNKDYKGQLAL